MASLDTTTLPGWVTPHDITTALAAGANTVTKAVVYKFGTQVTVQLTYSDASTGYIKFNATGPFKVGGADNTFATGTEVLWEA